MNTTGFTVKVINKDDLLLDAILYPISLQWSYDRIGGCGNFSMMLPSDVGKGINGDFEIRILHIDDVDFVSNKYGGPKYAAGQYGGSLGETLWYRGYVQNKRVLDGEEKNIEISGSGYSKQLNRVNVNETFTSTEISDIVKSIMTDISSQTDIDQGTIEATGFTPDTITFANEPSDRVLQKLAELAGNFEWGVDRNKELFFVEKETAIQHKFFKSVNVAFHESEDFFEAIKNSIIISGGETGGSVYTQTIEDSVSIGNFGQRTLVVQNSSITTSSVGTQLGNSILSESAIPNTRGKVGLEPCLRLIEENIPLGTLAVMDGEVAIKYGVPLYGSGKYGSGFPYQIDKIMYALIGDQVLIQIDLGKSTSSLIDSIKQLDYNIDQNRQNI